MTKPSPQQARVLDFIKARDGVGQPFPTRREIADHMGWKNVSGALDCLHALSANGYLERTREGRQYVFSLPVPL